MILASFAFVAVSKDAEALTAGEIAQNMSTDERLAYVAGVVEGLAYARWLADGKDATGQQCIWDWYLGSDQRVSDVSAYGSK